MTLPIPLNYATKTHGIEVKKGLHVKKSKKKKILEEISKFSGSWD